MKLKMKKINIKTIVLHMLVGANIVAILLLFFLCGTTWLSPSSWPHMSVMGLGFPFAVLLNFMFLGFWLIFYIRYALVPVLGFLVCFSFLRDYCPINRRELPPDGSLKLLTYNVAGFGLERTADADENDIVRYVQNSEAHIICLQEAYPGKIRNALDRVMKDKGYFVLPSVKGHDMEHTYSKFPVLKSERVPIISETNGAMAYWIKVEEDTVCLINCHLESNHLTAEDKDVYHGMLDSLNRDRVESGGKLLIRKLAKASALRGPQVDEIRRFYQEYANSVIVCGDFNDSPISYTCRTFSKDLNSAFVQSGNGPGISFNQRGFWFRIDHIFYSDDWETYASQVDKTIDASDHYPLFTYLRKSKTP